MAERVNGEILLECDDEVLYQELKVNHLSFDFNLWRQLIVMQIGRISGWWITSVCSPSMESQYQVKWPHKHQPLNKKRTIMHSKFARTLLLLFLPEVLLLKQ